MKPKRPGNSNQLWKLRDAPPNLDNRYPEITTQKFYAIKNVATGQYMAAPSSGKITATSSSPFSVSRVAISK